MIYSLRGTLTVKEAGLAVIECAGVGYACRTTYNTLAALGNEGGEETLYTYMQVTQDGVSLFGFYSKAELRSFQMLLGVTGVGAKAALSILSDMDPNSFALAVATSNFKQLTKARGVGQKMAQRIVLELKDKVAKEQKFSSAELASVPVQGGSNIAEAMTALQTLGFNPAQCGAALSGANPDSSVEELIKFGLKNLG